MYFAGFTQGLMWKEFTEEGILRYPNFLETVIQILPMYVLRSIGGALYLAGVVVMTYNLIKTARAGKLLADEPAKRCHYQQSMSLQDLTKNCTVCWNVNQWYSWCFP